MTGSPLLRALLAFLAVALTGLPLWQLTRPAPAVAAPESAAVAASGIGLALTFSAAPEKLTVLHLGKVVWTQDAPGLSAAKTVALEFPEEGVDLQFQIVWPPAVEQGALRVKLTDAAGNESDKTVWGRGTMEEVITFP